MIFKKCFILISCLTCLLYESRACAHDLERSDVQILLTTGGLRDLTDLRTWFFTWRYDRTVASVDPNGVDASNNISEWMTALGPSVRRSDIEIILYHTDPNSFQSSVDARPLTERFPGNTFIAYVCRPENREVLTYLELAKEIERLELNADWVYRLDHYYAAARAMAEKGLQRKPPQWLRQRFLYQWLRTYPLPDAVVYVLDKEFSGKAATTTIQRWILLRYAEALHSKNRPVDANLAVCEVFDMCPSKRPRALQLLDTKPHVTDATFQKASKRQRLILKTMLAMRDPLPRMTDVRSVYRLDPSSRYWIFLATRELDKLEDDLAEWNTGRKRVPKVDRIIELETFLTSTLPLKNAEWECYVRLMLAQCATLRHDHRAAIEQLTSMKHRPTKALDHQHAVLLAYHYIATGEIHGMAKQERLAKLLLEVRQEPEPTPDTTSMWVATSLAQLASREYAKSGSTALAFLYSTYFLYGQWVADYEPYATSTMLNSALRILEGKELPNVSRFLSTGQPPSLEYMHQRLSCAYASEGRFRDAATSARAWESARGVDQYSISDVNGLEPFWPRYVGARRFTLRRWRASVLYDSLAMLEELAKQANTPCRTLLHRAHALYSTTYYGSSWRLSRMERGEDEPSKAPKESTYRTLAFKELPDRSRHSISIGSNADYYSLRRAIAAYRKASACASSEAERSEAEYMLALCDRNRQLSVLGLSHRSYVVDPLDRINHSAFRKYYRRYGGTSFAQRYNCPTLRAYAGSLTLPE